MIMIKSMTMSTSCARALHTDSLPGHEARARPTWVLGRWSALICRPKRALPSRGAQVDPRVAWSHGTRARQDRACGTSGHVAQERALGIPEEAKAWASRARRRNEKRELADEAAADEDGKERSDSST